MIRGHRGYTHPAIFGSSGHPDNRIVTVPVTVGIRDALAQPCQEPEIEEPDAPSKVTPPRAATGAADAARANGRPRSAPRPAMTRIDQPRRSTVRFVPQSDVACRACNRSGNPSTPVIL